MPSFDIVSKVDPQVLDNAVNVTKKEVTNRFDFKDSPVKIELNKKDSKIDLEAESDMKVKQIIDVLVSRLRQKMEQDPREPTLIQTIRGGGYMFSPQVNRA